MQTAKLNLLSEMYSTCSLIPVRIPCVIPLPTASAVRIFQIYFLHQHYLQPLLQDRRCSLERQQERRPRLAANRLLTSYSNLEALEAQNLITRLRLIEKSRDLGVTFIY
jgi:hypothetical protein